MHDVGEFARQLQEERQRLFLSLEQEGITRQTALKEGIQELSVVDNHPADSGSELFERSKDLAFHSKNIKMLKEVEGALQRIAEGKYGICPGCTGLVERERLKVLPQALYCTACQKHRELQVGEERSPVRPVEERHLFPPFERILAGESHRYGEESAWEEVARYGTASSPQDTPEEMAGPDELE